jgi:hypothetical protein
MWLGGRTTVVTENMFPPKMILGWRKPERRAQRLQQQRKNLERESRAKFEARWWSYWEVVAWACYRDASRLHDLLPGLSRGDKWYNSKEYQSHQQVREAIQSGKIIAFDENGNEVKPLADFGRDPKIFFKSDTMKSHWPSVGSNGTTIAATLDLSHMSGDYLKRFHSYLVSRRADQNGYPLPDELQLVSLNNLKAWIDPYCVRDLVRDVHGVKSVLASDVLAKLAGGWRPSPPQNKSPQVRAELERAYVHLKNGSIAPQDDESSQRPVKAWKVKPGMRLTATENAILNAVNALWPTGEVDHKAKARNVRINDWLRQNNKSGASTRTMQRLLRKIRFA